MNKSIGPTLGSELISEGVFNGVAWNTETGDIWFNDDVPQSQRDAVMAVVAAHDPTKQVVPEKVTRYQGEVMARRRGWYEPTDAIFAALSDDDSRKIAWLKSPTWQRYSATTLYAAEQLQISDVDLDAAFIEADQVK